MPTKTQLVDSQKAPDILIRYRPRFLCKDADWVMCPWNALEIHHYCGKPDVECEHRGGSVWQAVVESDDMPREKSTGETEASEKKQALP